MCAKSANLNLENRGDAGRAGGFQSAIDLGFTQFLYNFTRSCIDSDFTSYAATRYYFRLLLIGCKTKFEVCPVTARPLFWI